MKYTTRGVVYLFLILQFILCSSTLAASELQPVTDSLGLITLFSTQPVEPFKLDGGVYLNYDDSPIKDVVDYTATANLVGSVGLHERLSLGFRVPYHHIEYTEDNEQGIGDAMVNAKLRLFTSSLVNAGLVPYVSLPTGDEDKALGSGNTDYGLILVMDKAFPLTDLVGKSNLPNMLRHLDYVNIVGNLGARINKDMKKNEADYLHGGVGVLVPFSPDIDLMAEIFGHTNVRHPIEKKYENDTVVEGLVSFRYYTTMGLTFTAGIGRGLNDSPGSPAWSAIVGITPARRVKEVTAPEPGGVPSPSAEQPAATPESAPTPLEGKKPPAAPALQDRDNDGIPDIYDYCPDEPEDYNGIEDFDGCPDSPAAKGKDNK